MLAERRAQAIIDDIDALDYAKVTGRAEGKTTLLTQMLARKFGPLSAEVQERILAASPETLDDWALNLLDATSLQDVFYSKSARIIRVD